MRTSKAKPKTIDEYLATVSATQRTALEKLRKQIKAVVPKAEECISYQIPAFRLNGGVLVFFGAATNHVSFYPGAFPIEACKNELKNHDISKGTIRFQPDKPLSTALVRKLVKLRIAQNTKPKT